ncbi:MAG: hypothetical protein KJ977_05340 [Candidatus Omnitrophica bacterium]|nr:hypothetical protein [Candidatus Omnitrophota bacterium]
MTTDEIRRFAVDRLDHHLSACESYFDSDGCPSFPPEPTSDDERAFRALPGERTEYELDELWNIYNGLAVTKAATLPGGLVWRRTEVKR